MAHHRKTLSRVLTTIITTALVSLISLLALSPAAFARVTIVPGSVDGGGTETFAIRLANERTDTPSTRLELTFPADVVVPVVEVARARGWTATVTTRPLDPPVTIGDEEFDEAVASIVWEGGEVAPRQFEQFLVTAGPLPADGRLVLTAEQGYADGTADRWTDPAAPGAPGAPTIVLVPRPVEAPAGQPVESAPAPGVVDSAAPSAAPVVDDAPAAEQTDLTLWFVLAAGLLVFILAVVGYRFAPRRKPTTRPDEIRPMEEAVPERVGRR